MKEEHKEVRQKAPMTTKAGSSQPIDLAAGLAKPKEEGKTNSLAKLMGKKGKDKKPGAASTLEALLGRTKKN